MKRKIRLFLRKFKFVVAAVLVLMLFISGSFSASADSYASNSINSYYVNTPVSLVFRATYYNPQYFDYYSTGVSVTPLITYSAADTADVLYIDDGSTLNTETVQNYSAWRYLVQPSYNNTENYGAYFRGRYNYYLSNLRLNSVSNISSTHKLENFTLHLFDFYCWDEGYFDDSLFGNDTSEISITYDGSSDSNNSNVYIDRMQVTYSLPGDSYSYATTTMFYSEELNGEAYDSDLANGFILFTPDKLGFTDYDLVYIHNVIVYFTGFPTVVNTLSLNFDVTNCFVPDLLNYEPDNGDYNPAIPLMSYTDWMGTAVSGFLDMQIFPGFTLGGIFMTLLAFTCVIWFLKLVAGG